MLEYGGQSNDIGDMGLFVLSTIDRTWTVEELIRRERVSAACV